MSHPLMKTFAAAKKRRPPECADCSDLGSCHGGCLKDRLPGRASAPGKTLFCAGYRELFAATGRQMDEWTEEIAARSRRDSPAPGRNDPCPCGSGSKFKHCHGKNAAAKETA